MRPGVIVGAPKQGDVIVSEASAEKQVSQVLLGGDGLGEHDGLAATATITTQIENDSDGVLERARFGIVRKGSGASDKALDASQLGRDRLTIGRNGQILAGLFDPLFFLQIVEHLDHIVGDALTRPEPAEPRGNVLQTCSQRGDRRRHEAVKPDQEQPPLPTGEGIQ